MDGVEALTTVQRHVRAVFEYPPAAKQKLLLDMKSKVCERPFDISYLQYGPPKDERKGRRCQKLHDAQCCRQKTAMLSGRFPQTLHSEGCANYVVQCNRGLMYMLFHRNLSSRTS